MWTSVATIAIILAIIAGAYWVGLRMGKTKEQKDNAEDRADETARDAVIASKPFKARPLSGMKPK